MGIEPQDIIGELGAFGHMNYTRLKSHFFEYQRVLVYRARMSKEAKDRDATRATDWIETED